MLRFQLNIHSTHLDRDLGRLLGHIVSERCVYFSEKNDVAGVMISNTDLDIINTVDNLIRRIFDTATHIQLQPHSERKPANASVGDKVVTEELYTSA